MAWKAIPNNPNWEYDDSVGSAGIRVWVSPKTSNTHEVYVNCRKVGSAEPSRESEISKTYWDAHP
jgi:hypothetical protein